MNLVWEGGDDYYHTTLAVEADKKAAIQQQILKILELSEGKEDWNVVTLDKWVDNLGRLIGHIQNDQEAVGYDKGYRVAIQFLDYYNQLNEAYESDDFERYDDVVWDANEEIDAFIHELVEDTAFIALLKERHAKTPFSIELANRGQRIDVAFDLFA